jgi:Ran GTPase-activating protein (RanGAP) involved in mRNA processing and transport
MASFLGSVSSRFLKAEDGDDDFTEEISAEDQAWIKMKCEEYGEWDDNVMSFWIRKIKKEERKRVKRIVCVTAHRVFSVAKSGGKYEIKRQSHLMDLTTVHEQGLVLLLEFRGFKIQFQVGEDTDMVRIMATMYKNYTSIDPGFPKSMTCKWLDQYKADQAPELKKKVPVRTQEFAVWERPLNAFISYCSFYHVDVEKLSGAMQSCLSRDMLDKHDERWVRCPDLGITHPRVVAGLMISLAFTEKLVHGVEIGSVTGDPYLYDSIILFLRNNGTVRHMIMDGVCSSAEWGSIVFQSLRENTKTNLFQFAIKNAEFGDKGLHNYIEGLKKLPRHPASLALTNIGTSSFKSMETLISAFVGKSEVGKGLVELDLSANPLGKKGTERLAKRIANGDFPDLKTLRLQRCQLHVPKLLSGIELAQKKGSVQLEELSISFNKMTAADGLILSRIIAHAGSTVHLEVAGCGLEGSVVASLVASLMLNDKLEYYVVLDASMNPIGGEGAIMIASIIHSTDRIMSMKLNDCSCTHEGIGYLLKALEHQPRLRQLELDNNVKRSEWDTGRHLVSQCLRSIVDKAAILETISLRSDPERGFQYELDHFLDALRRNTNIVSVDITGNSMTSDNMEALRDVIIKNEVMQRLYWDDNNVSAAHIAMFIHALKQNRALQLVEFPEKDFAKLLKEAGKSKKKRLELELLKKSFYDAMFENSQASGFAFDSGALALKRTQAKRATIMPKVSSSDARHGGGKAGGPSAMSSAAADDALASMAMYGGTRIGFS